MTCSVMSLETGRRRYVHWHVTLMALARPYETGTGCVVRTRAYVCQQPTRKRTTPPLAGFHVHIEHRSSKQRSRRIARLRAVRCKHPNPSWQPGMQSRRSNHTLVTDPETGWAGALGSPWGDIASTHVAIFRLSSLFFFPGWAIVYGTAPASRFRSCPSSLDEDDVAFHQSFFAA